MPNTTTTEQMIEELDLNAADRNQELRNAGPGDDDDDEKPGG